MESLLNSPLLLRCCRTLSMLMLITLTHWPPPPLSRTTAGATSPSPHRTVELRPRPPCPPPPPWYLGYRTTDLAARKPSVSRRWSRHRVRHGRSDHVGACPVRRPGMCRPGCLWPLDRAAMGQNCSKLYKFQEIHLNLEKL
jgi:hypothetical protein